MKSASALGNEAEEHGKLQPRLKERGLGWEGLLLLLGAAVGSLASLCLQDTMLKSFNTGQTAKGTAKQHHSRGLLVARKEERGSPKSFRL